MLFDQIFKINWKIHLVKFTWPDNNRIWYLQFYMAGDRLNLLPPDTYLFSFD